MKKLITMLLIVATLAAMTVNCFAADISTAVTDLDLIYFDDFSDPNKYNYGADDNYIAEIDGQSLYMMSATGDHTAYMLPGAPELSGLTKITFVYSWVYETFTNMREVGMRYGMTEATDGFLVAITPDTSNGVKAYYAPIEEGKPAKASLSLATCRRYGYMYTDAAGAEGADATKRIKDFPTDMENVWTIVIEQELGADPVTTFYINGEPCDWYMAEPSGNKEYTMAADTDLTFDGKLGFVIKAGGILLDGVAVYGTTGLDHRELVAKVASESGEGAAAPAETEPAAPAETEPAPAETEPAAPAETEPAPAETEPAAPAETEPAAPAETTPAETEPAPAEGGCGGVIGVGAIVAILGCAVVLKKKD